MAKIGVFVNKKLISKNCSQERKGLLMPYQFAKRDPSDLPFCSSRTPLPEEISISNKGSDDRFTKGDSDLNDSEI